MDVPKRILIIEDEPVLASVLDDYLRQAGMQAEILNSGIGAVERILTTSPDLVVLDVMLPGKDGLSIIREVRAVSMVPIILQSAKVEEIDRLLGLELGADDYVCKPFSPRELVARIKTILRRVHHQTAPDQADRVASRLHLDPDKWIATVDAKALDLTRREFQLLLPLWQRPGRVFSRSQLLELAFQDDHDVVERTVDSHIKNIRNKIKDIAADFDPIRSVYGVGYAFDN